MRRVKVIYPITIVTYVIQSIFVFLLLRRRIISYDLLISNAIMPKNIFSISIILKKYNKRLFVFNKYAGLLKEIRSGL